MKHLERVKEMVKTPENLFKSLMEHTMAEWPTYKQLDPWSLKDAVEDNLFQNKWPALMQNCDSIINEVHLELGTQRPFFTTLEWYR